MQTNNLTNTLQDMSFFRLREGHIIKPFDCEDQDLNEFLFQEAGFEFLTKLDEEDETRLMFLDLTSFI